jgi:hypothetical protein
VVGAVSARSELPPVARAAPLALKFIPAPRGAEFGTPRWVAREHQLALTVFDGPNVWDHHIAMIGLDGSRLRRLPIPDDAHCPWNAASWPTPLADGRLAFIRECYGNRNRLPLKVKSIFALDPPTNTVKSLRPYYLSLRAGGMDFSRDGRGIYNDGYGLTEHLVWLSPTAPHRLRLPLARVGTPCFSPDGRFIALDGRSAGSQPITPMQADLPRNLYIFNVRTRTLRLLVRKVADTVQQPAWSPDGRWLALALDPEDGPPGLWLVEVATGKHFLVASGSGYGSSDWLPDGHTVVATLTRRRQHAGLAVIKLPNLAKLRSS